MNPYRDAFYQKQAEWHHYEGPDHVRSLHELRRHYYEWWTRDWLPGDRDGKAPRHWLRERSILPSPD